ncbi:hypothetical protein [Agaribacterium sp. ZY112]|uniref:hypothetical protein n=1 Tax=Agaribacterium sp. ZY112 TaxID=3233574 RepID=UPI003524D6B8
MNRADNNSSTGIQRLKQLLIKHYTAPQIAIFKSWRDGFIYFSVGMICIYMANTYVQNPLYQELVALLGLLLAGLGFIIAMRAYLHLLISRLLRFFRR